LVADEAGRGDAEAVKRRLEAMKTITSLTITEEAIALAARLTERHALPSEAGADALHIAVAAVSGMDVLMTWNCRHMANAELASAIRETIESAGYEPPIICTPDELLGGES
jgi:hypothetical protein